MGVARATVDYPLGPCGRVNRRLLPAIVREGLVGLRHPMGVLALPDGSPAILGSVHQLMGEAKRHGLLAAITSGLDDPAHGQCLAARGPNFNRDLIRRATDTAGLHLDDGLDVVERGGEHLDRLRTLLAGL